MIYIDPPYNTGNDFVYHDDFHRSQAEEDLEAGNVDELGNRFVKNTETNGKFHSDWCSMIYPRLQLAHTLLSEDGAIFVSIDDNEVENLRKICDEIFGEDNFVACLIWEQGRKSMSAQIATNHEYCLIYCKNRQYEIETNSRGGLNWKVKKQGLEAIYEEESLLRAKYGVNYGAMEVALKEFYKNLPDSNPSKAHSHYRCIDGKGIYFPGDISQGTGKGGRFDILHPITHKPVRVPKGGWRFSEKKLPELLKENRIHFGDDESVVPCLKRYLKETEYEVATSVFYKDGRGASKRLDSLIGKGCFPYPKDEEVIKTFISFVSPNRTTNEDIILDFFSGSATTAHAVMQLNAEDGGHRKFILVQLPEETDQNSEAYKAGYKNICEIGEERIRCAGKKIKEDLKAKRPDLFTNGNDDKQTLDTGFRVFRVDSSNMKDVYFAPKDLDPKQLDLFADNVKEDRTGLDLLYGCMVDWGVQLSLPLTTETIDSVTVYTVNDGDLVACFGKPITDKVVKAMADKAPLRVLFRDSCFEKDEQKINIFEQFKQLLGWSDDEALNNIRVI